MTLLATEKISKKFKDQIILDQVSMTIQQGQRIALVGKNGIGKTTLLEILAGKQSPDSGTITSSRSCKIDYIEQEKEEYLSLSLFEFVADARSDLLDLYRIIQSISEELQHQPENQTILRKLGDAQQKFEADGGFDFENEISIILQGLGFEKERYSERLQNFSGGEKNRAGLARILAGNGTMLLLDEPTNHLDIESTIWLEDYLAKLDKSFIVVSHDRAFLNATVEQVWELRFGKIETYVGSYQQYIKDRSERNRHAEHHYRHQQEEIKRIEDFIQRNMAGQKTKQAQSKLKYLNRIKRLKPPKGDGKGPTIKMKSSGRSWSHVLHIENVSIGYGSRVILNEIDLDIYRGDKIGLVGRNGSGKTSLIKALIGELEPLDGSIALGNNVEVAYFDQELSDLDDNMTVLDSLWQLDQTAESGVIRSFLGRFGFTGEESMKLTKSLSGGEKTKLCLARLFYHPANLIILDEPTNHLDVQAREALEDAIRDYDGSCLIVSHDRYFLNQITDRVVYLSEGRSRIFLGGYSEFKEYLNRNNSTTKETNSKSKQDYLSFKEQSKRRSKIKKEIQSTKSKIADNEKLLKQLEEDISHRIPRNDWEALEEASNKKHQIEDEILSLYDQLESLEAIEND